MHRIGRIKENFGFFARSSSSPVKWLPLCLCVSVVVFSSIVSAQHKGAGWVWQNPIPQGNHLNSIHFAKDRLNGVAVGSDSTIVRTTDGGFTWTRFTSPVDAILSDVYVRDKKQALIVGTRGTILTLVDGEFWREVPVSTKEHLHGLAFAGEVGWAVGTHGTVVKTTDSGGSWSLQKAGTTEHLMRAAAFD